jgi:ABC-type phosphate/phosphonate transport system substrate-binding protein
MSTSFAARAILFALSALVSVSGARGDAPSRTRVTIRGTGSGVVIERSEGPVRKRLSEATAVPAPAGPLVEAVRQKAQGASDTAVISYLRAHTAELPPVVGSDDVRQLRKAGAGKGVVAYLTTVAAVDIGETGEGYATAVSAAPGSPIDMETAPYGMSDAYALSGGYAASYPARLIHRGLPHVRRMTLPPGRPPFHRSIPMRGPFSRLPATE